VVEARQWSGGERGGGDGGLGDGTGGGRGGDTRWCGGERGCGGGGGGEGAVVEGMVAAVTVAAVMAMEGTAMAVAEEDVVLCDKIHEP